MKLTGPIIVAAITSILVGVSPALAGNGGGSWHGGGGGDWHGGCCWHGGWHGGWGVSLGFGPWWGYPYGYYPYPYAYAPYPYTSAPPYPYASYPVTSAAPPVPANVWYYCRSKKGYYPYVSSCSEAWQQVPARPPNR